MRNGSKNRKKMKKSASNVRTATVLRVGFVKTGRKGGSNEVD